MPRTRVLVVDDSSVVRRLVSEALASDPAIELVGTAPNGRIALAKLTQVNPDVVTLDIEMPELDGLATLVELRRTHPLLPVIMFSAITERGAAATLEAIARGANDYVTKPSTSEGVEDARQKIAEQLLPRVRAFAPASAPAWVDRVRVAVAPAVRGKAEIVAIGVSTGGPNALTELIPRLPRGFPVPVVVVQHMPPVFTRLLAERLAARSALPVTECADEEPLRPGHVYIARGDWHMVVRGSRLDPRVALVQGPPENSCRPAVDVLFRSVAAMYGPSALAVVLTGMGQDGLHGCRHVREVGGRVLVQDQATSVIWGMPGAVARAGMADRVLPLLQLADELARQVSGLPPAPVRATR
jgi:two-component system chemotaxis response regulator CheB